MLTVLICFMGYLVALGIICCIAGASRHSSARLRTSHAIEPTRGAYARPAHAYQPLVRTNEARIASHHRT